MIKNNNIKLIKICGLTDPETALVCAQAGADAIGLVFYRKSPRNVSDEIALTICQDLPDKIITTGVFVNENFNFIMEKVRKCSLKAVQLHGNEKPKLIADLKAEGLIVIKGIFANKEPFFKQANLYKNASYLLAECGKGVLPGGNAKAWNWQEISRIDTKLPIILAGGLDPSSIHKVKNQVNVAGFDVSSGVESSPGIKDIKKVVNFIKNTRSSPSR